MKPQLKEYLIAYSHTKRMYFMPDIPVTEVLRIAKTKQPTVDQCKQAIKADNMNKKFKNLQILSIDLIGNAKEVKKDKEIDNTINISAMKPNKLGFDEVVDTLVDAIEVGLTLGEAAKDGIQIDDAFVLLGQAKNIEEIYRDAPIAWAQFKDLTPEESKLAAEQIAERLNAEPGTVKDVIRQSVSLVTRGYALVSDVIAFADQFKKAA